MAMTHGSVGAGRENWSGRLAFVFAATGSAVGLGNIWKFPYIAGDNGGGAFVLVYMGCIFLFGIPLMMSELLVGRRGAGGPSECFERLAVDSGASPHWHIAGDLGVIASFLILSFYSVVGGWSISYVIDALQNNFSGASSEQTEAIFNHLLADPARLLLWHSVFMLMVAGVVARGISHGIERVLSIIMPVMFLLLLGLVAYAFTLPAFGKTLAFLFQPDFSSLSSKGVLLALGQAFFSLSLGMSVMIAYGSHLPKNVSIGSAALTVSLLDTLCATLAGLAIFTIAFSNGLSPGAGPGLVFQTMPIAFGAIDGGYIIGLAFFLLLLFAAWSSAISLLEPIIERVETLTSFNRRGAAIISAGGAWLLGVLCALSFNVLADFKPLFDKNIFDLADFTASNVLLPVTGILVAAFGGWVLTDRATHDELALKTPVLQTLWRFSVRFICPLMVTVVLIESAAPGTISAIF